MIPAIPIPIIGDTIRRRLGALICKATGEHRPDWPTAIMCGLPVRCTDCDREL